MSKHETEILAALKCDYPSDCVYFSKRNKDYFGVGLYFLEDEHIQSRVGGISIYNTSKVVSEFSKDPKTKLTGKGSEPELFINAESGVVNFEWCQFGDDCCGDGESNGNGLNLSPELITCLCSDKTIKYFYVDLESLNYRLLNSVRSENINDNNSVIGLDLSTIPRCGTKKTCYSISDGRVFIIKDMEFIETEFVAHKNTEVWTVSFLDNIKGDILATGGDDCVLSLWDLRTNVNSLYDGVVKNSKAHTMGVTCVEKYDSFNNHLFWSGSYDETLSLWDVRSLSSPLHQINVGGGVWRINSNSYDSNGNYVGLALCYFGFKFYNASANGDVYSLREISAFPNEPEDSGSVIHTSMVYGIDTLHNHDKHHDSILSVTSSFYDNTVVVSSINFSD